MRTRARSNPQSAGIRGGGFTLVELLVVMTLMAMLLAISLPRYLGAADTARLKAREQNLATLRDSLDKFRADQGRYPSELAELTRQRYLRAIPLDPVSGTAAWTAVASPTETGVYDVAPPHPDAVAGPALLPSSAPTVP